MEAEAVYPHNGSALASGDGGFYCHVCEAAVSAHLDNETQEFVCEQCGLSFVEARPNNATAASPWEEEEEEEEAEAQAEAQEQTEPEEEEEPEPEERGLHDAIPEALRREMGALLVQNIVNRVLGLGVQTQPSQRTDVLSVLQQAVTESGRPVGIVIRQAASPSEVDLLTSLMGHSGVHSQAEADDAYNPLDMFGLGGLAGAAAAAEEQRQQSWADLLHHLMMNDPNRYGAPPAPKEAIDALPRRILTKDEAERMGECTISQEPFEENDTVLTLPCTHEFKAGAVTHWLEQHNSCPICRLQITPLENSESP